VVISGLIPSLSKIRREVRLVPLPALSIDLLAFELPDIGDLPVGDDMDLLVVEAGDEAQAPHRIVLEIFRIQLFARIHLDDADIDPAQEHDVAQILQRAAADHRQHAQVFAVEHVGEVGGDADIGTVRAPRDHPERACIGPGGLGRERRLGWRGLGRGPCKSGHQKGRDEKSVA
jgi:hypothetical protein